MNPSYDIVALGECLVDLVCTEKDGKIFMEGNPGGAPANVLAMAQKLGQKTALISKVGQDSFGAFLRTHMAEAGMDARYILEDAQHPTTLAIVRLDETGNRDFSFYRDRTADVMLNPEELPAEALTNTKILQYGSLSLVAEPARAATFAAIDAAKAAGAKTAYDPNWRPPLWPSQEAGREMMQKGMEKADLVKVSEEELTLLTGESDPAAGAAALLARYPMQLLAVTMGPEGSMIWNRRGSAAAKAYTVDCLDTTGAGDAFWGAALTWLLEHELDAEDLSTDELMELADFANAAGSLATTKKGAIPAMPDREAILGCMKREGRIGFGHDGGYGSI